MNVSNENIAYVPNGYSDIGVGSIMLWETNYSTQVLVIVSETKHQWRTAVLTRHSNLVASDLVGQSLGKLTASDRQRILFNNVNVRKDVGGYAGRSKMSLYDEKRLIEYRLHRQHKIRVNKLNDFDWNKLTPEQSIAIFKATREAVIENNKSGS